MASVSHRNLATIFGAETWHGRPMLVCEYLAGGTLANRMERGPLSLDELIEIGLALCWSSPPCIALVYSSATSSNEIIGFAEDGTPKLLDFGYRPISRRSLRHPEAESDGAARAMTTCSPTAAHGSAMRGTRCTCPRRRWSALRRILPSICGACASCCTKRPRGGIR